ncbi:unnamed protein product [Nippostrongylus brasiliensis]|uniref:Antitoxin n=1 Tax=Nippostrongylus brasiliensis TaxID=27835 RepID=A0A0N4YGP5_NIPBR|nr:unnamed protein product [Nippostrongylus brasiliensis]
MTICTYNARTLASDASVEDLMMRTRKIKNNVIGLTETRKHRPLHVLFDIEEFLESPKNIKRRLCHETLKLSRQRSSKSRR